MMNTTFSQRKAEKDSVEQRLTQYKKEYEKPTMSQEQLQQLKLTMEEATMKTKNNTMKTRVMKFAATAAAVAGVMVVLPNTSAEVAYAMEQLPVIGHLVEVVTFRDYEYSSERNMAEIDTPKLQTNTDVKDTAVSETLEKTTDEINAEIQEITENLIKAFQTDLEEEQGYQDITVNSEILATTEDYFTLKLICYQGAGSGYEWNYYYTIDLNTGERLQLKDIFVEGSDYITPISENIKEQMQAQMDADENVRYWLNDPEVGEWNFSSITDDTSFYINEKDMVVIGFNEGDVAPMYMGTVEFEIPNAVVADIRK